MRRACLLLSLLALAAPVRAQDLERGKMLYETHCGACHYQRVHQRTTRTVQSLPELRDTVARWAPQTRHRFSLQDMEAVTQHLNRAYYGFPTK